MPVEVGDGQEAYPVRLDTLKKLERMYNRVMREDIRNAPDRGSYYDEPVIALAKNGGSVIAARSGTTPGSGSVTIYHCEETTLEASTTSTATITAYNLAGSTVAANAYLMLVRIGNKWWVMFEDCG